MAAYQAIDHGPVPNLKVPNPNTSKTGGWMGSWNAIPFNTDVFVWSVHKWGSKDRIVGQ